MPTKHFSKWLKLIPLSYCNSEETTYAYLDRVFNRFGALAKVLLDQSTKFYGEFQKLCRKTLINHHTISQDHFEANKLTKQMLQMMKQCF
jgi:hypothetical protein